MGTPFSRFYAAPGIRGERAEPVVRDSPDDDTATPAGRYNGASDAGLEGEEQRRHCRYNGATDVRPEGEVKQRSRYCCDSDSKGVRLNKEKKSSALCDDNSARNAESEFGSTEVSADDAEQRGVVLEPRVVVRQPKKAPTSPVRSSDELSVTFSPDSAYQTSTVTKMNTRCRPFDPDETLVPLTELSCYETSTELNSTRSTMKKASSEGETELRRRKVRRTPESQSQHRTKHDYDDQKRLVTDDSSDSDANSCSLSYRRPPTPHPNLHRRVQRKEAKRTESSPAKRTLVVSDDSSEEEKQASKPKHHRSKQNDEKVANSRMQRMSYVVTSSSDSDECIQSTQPRHILKPPKYDGTTPFETFFAQFRNCSVYNRWTKAEELAYLRNSLEKQAGQVLWDYGAEVTNSLKKLTNMLKQRFGGMNQVDKYRIEVRNRRRKAGESLQSLHSDIRRLAALAFPEFITR